MLWPIQRDRGSLVLGQLAEHVEQVPEVSFAIQLAVRPLEVRRVEGLAHEHAGAAQHRVPRGLTDRVDRRHADQPAGQTDRAPVPDLIGGGALVPTPKRDAAIARATALAADLIADPGDRGILADLEPGDGLDPGDRRADDALDRIAQEVQGAGQALEVAVVVALVVVNPLVDVALDAARWPGDEQGVPDLAVVEPARGVARDALILEHSVGVDESALEPILLDVEAAVDEHQQMVALPRRRALQPLADGLRVLDEAVGELFRDRALGFGHAVQTGHRLLDRLRCAWLGKGEGHRRVAAALVDRDHRRAGSLGEIVGAAAPFGPIVEIRFAVLVGKRTARPGHPLRSNGELHLVGLRRCAGGEPYQEDGRPVWRPVRPVRSPRLWVAAVSIHPKSPEQTTAG
jgi:hypothetical protein